MSVKGRRFQLGTQALEGYQKALEQKSEGQVLSGEGVVDIPLERLKAAPWNARKYFDPVALQELANELKTLGQIHPILVRPKGQDFEVVVGERRSRAAQMGGLKSLKATVRQLDDREAQQISLVENLGREDLNAYEETLGYLNLLALELHPLPEFAAFSQAGEGEGETAKRLLHRLWNERTRLAVGETGPVRGTALEQGIVETFARVGQMGWESYYQHRLPLLSLPGEVLQVLQQGQLEYSKARLVAKVQDSKARAKLLEEALRQQLSVSVLRERVRVLERGDQPLSLPQRAAALSKRLKGDLSVEQQKRVEKLLGELEQVLAKP